MKRMNLERSHNSFPPFQLQFDGYLKGLVNCIHCISHLFTITYIMKPMVSFFNQYWIWFHTRSHYNSTSRFKYFLLFLFQYMYSFIS